MIFIFPAISSFAIGFQLPIPILPVDAPVIESQKRTFMIFRLFDVQTCTAEPIATALSMLLLSQYPAFGQRKILSSPLSTYHPYPAFCQIAIFLSPPFHGRVRDPIAILPVPTPSHQLNGTFCIAYAPMAIFSYAWL